MIAHLRYERLNHLWFGGEADAFGGVFGESFGCDLDGFGVGVDEDELAVVFDCGDSGSA